MSDRTSPKRALFRLPRPVLAILALCVLASLLTYGWWDTRRDRIRTVSQGLVYQSGVLAPDDLRNEVRRLGIRTVIDLRVPAQEVQGEKTVLSEVGVKHVHLPSENIPDDATVNRFLDLMDDPATYPVLIHCLHGMGRSVLMGAIYRVEYEGWDREKARLATRSSWRWLFPGASFATDAPKGTYLLNYVKRGRSAALAREPGLIMTSRPGAVPAGR